MWTAFEYVYRDADNFKAFGTVTLDGAVSEADESIVRTHLNGGEFFIAEQIGVPPLYKQLYQWSDGPTRSDHCWHEFVCFRELTTMPEDTSTAISASEFVRRFGAIQEWNEELSGHFWL
jgi:hypothetical protein